MGKMSDFHKGDTIRCKDADDMVEIMTNLAIADIESNFMYEKDGESGFWIEITKTPKEKI